GNAIACLTYTNPTGPCRACMDANAPPGDSTCTIAVGSSCAKPTRNDDCSTDVNTYGCGAACCTPVCGDNIIEGSEQCDGTDATACPGLCRGDCTCPPPVCGNNVREAAEDCDGTDDTPCDGLCEADCTCAVLCGANSGGICPNSPACPAGQVCSPSSNGLCYC